MDLNKDYYRILGLSKNASLKQIKVAYRNLALKFHPDRAPDDLKEQAESLFKEISEAYEILSNRQKKATYDLQYKHGINQQDEKDSKAKNTDNDNFQTTKDKILDALKIPEAKYFFTKWKIAAVILFLVYFLYVTSLQTTDAASGDILAGGGFFLVMILFHKDEWVLIGWIGMIMLGWFLFIIRLSNY